MILTLPILYKKSSTGAIQQWQIFVRPIPIPGVSDTLCAEIVVVHGKFGGKLQETVDRISKGKNAGKANETTALEQARSEAVSKHEKQRKKGYVETLEAAQNEKTDAIIEGGVLPMLAHKFKDHSHKINYPAHVQPKLDGIRCVAILQDGKCTLWSRTRKQIHSCPHIVEDIESNFTQNMVLDGELYNHAFKANFEHIVHLVRQEEPDTQCTDVQYHIYDIINGDDFGTRNGTLSRILTSAGFPLFQYLTYVETHVVENENEVVDWFQKFKGDGYEGCMMRNSSGLYVNKRSYDLQKVKEMQDEEFEIVGIEEGRGKLQGHVGAFVCFNNIGSGLFNVKMSGDVKKLKEYFENHSLWKNKKLTVQFQDRSAYGVPRFPVGLRIREPE